MARLHKIPVTPGNPDEYITFKCPGCKDWHTIPVTGPKAWEFNSDLDRPTIKPSILVRWDFADRIPQKICHSLVTDGRIQFLPDCTHSLAGKTIDLPEVE